MSAHGLSRLIAFVMSLFCAAAQSASISLTPANQNVALGDAVTVQLTMDFSEDATLGGGVDVFYDASILQFVSFVFDAGLGGDPSFERNPDELAGELNGIGFGHFEGLSGPSLVGTFTFNTLKTGVVNFLLSANDFPAGDFISATTFEAQTVSFSGTTVNVSVVPLPAAAWLLMSGLGLFAFSAGARRHAI